MMNVRKKIWPKTIADGLSMFFILTIIPLIYWFELWVVLPNLYEPGAVAYMIHFVIGNFIMINIVGNLTYTILIDTSTRPLIMSISKAKAKEGWRFCASCEAVSPPRSWHCQTCGVCILKRDHHCIFTGCCIGHFNHRYFLMFVFYLFLATAYAFYYNNKFIWSRISFEFPLSIIKIIFPLAIFVFGFDDSWDQFYLMLYIVSVVGMCFTGALLVYHLLLVFSGHVAHEKDKKINKYDMGWKQNIKEALGEKWYIVWLFPYIKSDLLHNGLNWNVSPLWKDSAKNR
ncbi:probable palmitoyltransferase ZDHHC24 [Chelonus insularis]|uniref:probable palmitoyltransferase ZDHHC24 n=1 Tax=Chelonus insularis TaxID=460826 RepID=UPI00158E7927|nr:probable palmitoyltransferase ZDHHC24 [Chelonus insularis]